MKGTGAFAELEADSKKKTYSRHHQGDLLGGAPIVPPALPQGKVAVCFKSVLQGDHAGVEFATSAHENLLISHGALSESSRLLSCRHSMRPDLMQGLVIDDFFAVGVRGADTDAEDCDSWKLHEKASQAYDKEGLMGSPEKDLWGEDSGRIIGAYLDSSEETRKRGLVTVSVPREKKYALSWISLQLCQLPSTSDSLHLCLLGGWVSALLYRRPIMSVLQHSFNLVQNEKVSEAAPKMVPLPRKVAGELVLLSVLAPLICSNIGASFLDKVFASDASNELGAVVSAPLEENLMRTIFNGCKSKGAYTRLDTFTKVLCREVGEEEEIQTSSHSVQRPLAYKFDFVEIFAGSAKVTKYISAMGLSVCTPVELSLSEEYDVQKSSVMRWLSHLLTNGFISGFMIEPPCTTFSVMRRPALRDRDHPFGFDPFEEKTRTGNKLGFRGFQTMSLGSTYGIPGALETPNSSKLKNFESWRRLAEKENVETVRADSCQFGSVHLKPFKFMVVEADASPLARRCTCKKKHVKVEGALTKDSAVYTDELAETLAKVLGEAILRRRKAEAELYDGRKEGLESLLVNDVAISSSWTLEKVWPFKKQSHINLKELAAVQKLVYDLSRKYSGRRIVDFVDSYVVRCAISKGRSSSRAIGAMLRRFCASLLASDFTSRFPTYQHGQTLPMILPG